MKPAAVTRRGKFVENIVVRSVGAYGLVESDPNSKDRGNMVAFDVHPAVEYQPIKPIAYKCALP